MLSRDDPPPNLWWLKITNVCKLYVLPLLLSISFSELFQNWFTDPWQARWAYYTIQYNSLLTLPWWGRLRVVPHFSSGIVERAKRERAWKSSHARKGDTPFLAWGDFHARSRFARSTILRFHCHAIKTAQKNTFETVQRKKPRKWNVIKD